MRIMSMCQLNVLEPMDCLPHEKKKRSLLPRITKTFVDINRTDEVPTARKRHPKNDRLIKSTGSRQFLGSAWELQPLTGMRFHESASMSNYCMYTIVRRVREIVRLFPTIAHIATFTHLPSATVDPEGIIQNQRLPRQNKTVWMQLDILRIIPLSVIVGAAPHGSTGAFNARCFHITGPQARKIH